MDGCVALGQKNVKLRRRNTIRAYCLQPREQQRDRGSTSSHIIKTQREHWSTGKKEKVKQKNVSMMRRIIHCLIRGMMLTVYDALDSLSDGSSYTCSVGQLVDSTAIIHPAAILFLNAPLLMNKANGGVSLGVSYGLGWSSDLQAQLTTRSILCTVDVF